MYKPSVTQLTQFSQNSIPETLPTLNFIIVTCKSSILALCISNLFSNQFQQFRPIFPKPEILWQGDNDPDQILEITAVDFFTFKNLEYQTNGQKKVALFFIAVELITKNSSKPSQIFSRSGNSLLETKTYAIYQQFVYFDKNTRKLLRAKPELVQISNFTPNPSIGIRKIKCFYQPDQPIFVTINLKNELHIFKKDLVHGSVSLTNSIPLLDSLPQELSLVSSGMSFLNTSDQPFQGLISSILIDQNYFVLGTSFGRISVFKIDQTFSYFSLQKLFCQDDFSAHEDKVTSLLIYRQQEADQKTSLDYLIAGCSNGEIKIFRMDKHLPQVTVPEMVQHLKSDTKDGSVTHLALHRDYLVICGYNSNNSGKLKIRSIENKTTAVE